MFACFWRNNIDLFYHHYFAYNEVDHKNESGLPRQQYSCRASFVATHTRLILVHELIPVLLQFCYLCLVLAPLGFYVFLLLLELFFDFFVLISQLLILFLDGLRKRIGPRIFSLLGWANGCLRLLSPMIYADASTACSFQFLVCCKLHHGRASVWRRAKGWACRRQLRPVVLNDMVSRSEKSLHAFCSDQFI